MRPTDILPAGIPFVRLVHPTDPSITVLVPATYLAELVPKGREG